MDKLDKIKKLIEDWINKQGHNRCWFYPEIFNKICEELGIQQVAPSCLPSRSDFEEGCRRYQNEQYLGYGDAESLAMSGLPNVIKLGQ